MFLFFRFLPENWHKLLKDLVTVIKTSNLTTGKTSPKKSPVCAECPAGLRKLTLFYSLNDGAKVFFFVEVSQTLAHLKNSGLKLFTYLRNSLEGSQSSGNVLRWIFRASFSQMPNQRSFESCKSNVTDVTNWMLNWCEFRRRAVFGKADAEPCPEFECRAA